METCIHFQLVQLARLSKEVGIVRTCMLLEKETYCIKQMEYEH